MYNDCQVYIMTAKFFQLCSNRVTVICQAMGDHTDYCDVNYILTLLPYM